MIAQLTGNIISSQPPLLILVVNNIGYEVLCPLNTFSNLNTTNHTIYTQLIIREDSHTLYGFNSTDEKIIFNTLIKVNGIGPKVALAILSTLSISDIINCVANDNVELLQNTPGIGKKSAQKIIVELKDRLPKLAIAANIDTAAIIGNNNINNSQALSALTSLGFKAKEAQKMLGQIDTTNLNTEQIIHLALKNK